VHRILASLHPEEGADQSEVDAAWREEKVEVARTALLA
jgi:hypothetical protein